MAGTLTGSGDDIWRQTRGIMLNVGGSIWRRLSGVIWRNFREAMTEDGGYLAGIIGGEMLG
jgi:hypothetical protein